MLSSENSLPDYIYIVNRENNNLSKEYTNCDKMLSVDNDFSSWLLQELEKRGWSQSELARRAGLSRGTLTNIVKGVRGIGSDTCESIARAFNYSPELVFRAAGILPAIPEREASFEDWLYLLDQLPEQDRAELYEFARLKIKLRKIEREQEALQRAKRSRPGEAGV